MNALVIRVAAVLLVALGLVAAPSAATASTAGFNDWDCAPSAAHPEPVVMLHGLTSNGDANFALMGPYLASRGHCAFSTTYGVTSWGSQFAGLASIPESAQEISDFVDKVRAGTGAAQVNIVAHSAGTTVAAYYMKFLGGDEAVKRFVGFGSNFKGSELDGLVTLMELIGLEPVVDAAGCPACVEFSPRSEFMKTLNEGGVAVPGPSYTSIVTRYDEVVTPYTSGILDAAPNVKNIVLQDRCGLDFSGHVGLAFDPNVFKLVANELDPANARWFWCTPMPWLG